MQDARPPTTAQLDWAQQWFANIADYLTRYGIRALGAILFLVAAWVLSAWAVRLMAQAMTRARVETTLAKFLSNVARWAMLVMALVACLGIFGVETTSFIAVLGSAGLAIGLAMQGSLSNLAAGVMLLLFRRFSVGDVITVGGYTGRVDEIELFCTRMDTGDNRRVIIPNSMVFNGVVENLSFNRVRRAEIDVGTDYTADVDHTRQVLLEAARSVPGRAADRDPDVILRQLGASSVDWRLGVWARGEDLPRVQQATIQATKHALTRAGIGIPYPQMVVHAPTVGAAPPPAPDTARKV